MLQASSATMFLRDEQHIRNAQVVGSSPTISSKTCVNIVFSQVFSFSETNFKYQYATKNLTLFYAVRFCSFIGFSVQDHLLTIYEFATFPPSSLLHNVRKNMYAQGKLDSALSSR